MGVYGDCSMEMTRWEVKGKKKQPAREKPTVSWVRAKLAIKLFIRSKLVTSNCNWVGAMVGDLNQATDVTNRVATAEPRLLGQNNFASSWKVTIESIADTCLVAFIRTMMSCVAVALCAKRYWNSGEVG